MHKESKQGQNTLNTWLNKRDCEAKVNETRDTLVKL